MPKYIVRRLTNLEAAFKYKPQAGKLVATPKEQEYKSIEKIYRELSLLSQKKRKDLVLLEKDTLAPVFYFNSKGNICLPFLKTPLDEAIHFKDSLLNDVELILNSQHSVVFDSLDASCVPTLKNLEKTYQLIAKKEFQTTHSNWLVNLAEVLRDIDKRMEGHVLAVRNADKQTLDFLHLAELEEVDPVKFTQGVSSLRKKRREHKDALEMLYFFKKTIVKPEVLLQKIEKSQAERQYKQRSQLNWEAYLKEKGVNHDKTKEKEPKRPQKG